MELLTNIVIGLVAALHLYFLWFEMFAWETTGRKIFRQMPAEMFPKTKALAANQGLYNGFLVAGLVWSLVISDPVWADKVALFFLTCVLIAGIFGAITASKKIFYVQGLPALVGIVLIAQVVVSIVAPFIGNSPTGDALEYWMYLITALLMVPAALIWSLIERVTISNVVLGVVGFSIAVMVVRMHQIWFVNGA
jgi:putative membrane protein